MILCSCYSTFTSLFATIISFASHKVDLNANATFYVSDTITWQTDLYLDEIIKHLYINTYTHIYVYTDTVYMLYIYEYIFISYI